jgi:hypothetical protein
MLSAESLHYIKNKSSHNVDELGKYFYNRIVAGIALLRIRISVILTVSKRISGG